MSLDEALELLAASPCPIVVVVGDRSRTWYVDHYAVGEVLACIAATRPDAVVRHAGKLPFDDVVEHAAEVMGLAQELWGPEDRTSRLEPYERNTAMLDGAALLVAFPVEDRDPETADPMVIAVAEELGVPRLDVRRT